MRKTIYKWIWAWDFDKEEKWLNEMAANGLVLVSTALCRYEFEDCVPGEYNVRLELLEELPSHPQSQQYISFIEESGAQCIGSYLRWVYFRKKTTEGSFDLYSDNASRIKHLNRVSTLITILAFINLTACLSTLMHLRWLAFFNCALTLFLGYGLFKLYRKKKRLKREQQLFE